MTHPTDDVELPSDVALRIFLRTRTTMQVERDRTVGLSVDERILLRCAVDDRDGLG